MLKEIESLLKQYWTWLADNTSLRVVEDYVEITTPLLDRHNDCFQIYVKIVDDKILITDDGCTITDLEMSGFNFNKSREILRNSILNGFDINLIDEKILQTLQPKEKFGLYKSNLLQAMIAIDDMHYTTQASRENVFKKEVKSWLTKREVPYESDKTFVGKSGVDHKFDFVLSKSNCPERLVSSLNRPDKFSAQVVAYSWIDTKAKILNGAEAYAILNDKSSVSKTVFDTLSAYDVHPIRWSNNVETNNLLVY